MNKCFARLDSFVSILEVFRVFLSDVLELRTMTIQSRALLSQDLEDLFERFRVDVLSCSAGPCSS